MENKEHKLEWFILNTPITHRGLWNDKDAPENSVAAFKHSIAANAPIETDIQIISDGTVIIFHDINLSRLCGVDKNIAELKKEDLAKYKLMGTQETIPTLSEFLKLIDGKVPVLFEHKDTGNRKSSRRMQENFMEEMKGYKGEWGILSFSPLVLQWFKNNAPHVTRGLNVSYFRKQAGVSAAKRFALKRMLFNKYVEPHFIDYDAAEIPNRLIRKKKIRNIPLIAYGVDSEEIIKRIMPYCKNIIFDRMDIEQVRYLWQKK